MNTARITLLFLVAFAVAVSPQEKGGDDVTGPYDLAANWPENVCGPGYQGARNQSADSCGQGHSEHRRARQPGAFGNLHGASHGLLPSVHRHIVHLLYMPAIRQSRATNLYT
jgi:hypothetical protein